MTLRIRQPSFTAKHFNENNSIASPDKIQGFLYGGQLVRMDSLPACPSTSFSISHEGQSLTLFPISVYWKMFFFPPSNAFLHGFSN